MGTTTTFGLVEGSASRATSSTGGVAHDVAVSDLASRAEDIASHLVSHALGAEVKRFDVDGRQSAVDFVLLWPDGRRGALEVTLVTDPRSSGWSKYWHQYLACIAGAWHWLDFPPKRRA